MINLTVLDNIIEAVGENNFIDSLLDRMPAEDTIAAVEGIAAENGLDNVGNRLRGSNNG